ncbi:unnamed protein product, partial [Candidula unifasciata]
MFPSSGYFRGVNCPFYVSGLCERPNCHFRHSRVEEKPKSAENGPNYSTSVKPYQPSSAQLFSSTPLQAATYGQKKDTAGYSASTQDETTASHEAGQNSASQVIQMTVSSSCPIPSFSDSPQTLPEPDELPSPLESLPRISGLAKPKLKGPESSGLPSYIPTPKRVQLIVKGAVPSYNPTPKHVESHHKKNSSHTVEYDPVKNFSFREKSNSDKEDVNHTGDIANETQKKDTESLQGESVQTVPANDSGNIDNPANADESDLTDSDEDVSQKYEDEKNPADKKLPLFANLLTPSSYFTEKLNSSVNRKLSSDFEVSSSVKSGVPVQQNSSIINSKSHKQSSSKTLHKLHHSRHSQLSSKASSSSVEKSKVLKSTSLSSERNNNLASSTHPAKPCRSTSNSEVKHSNTDQLNKSALKVKPDKSLLHSSKDAKIQSGSVSKKENKHKSNTLSSSLSSSQKNKSNSSSSSQKNKSNSSSSSQKNKSNSSSSSQKNKSNSLSSSEKTRSNSSSSSQKKKSSSSSSKNDSRKADSAEEASHKFKSKDLSNGQSVHKKENVVQTSDKSSRSKHSDSQNSPSGQTSEVKETVQRNDASIKKIKSTNSSLKSDSRRRNSLNGHSSTYIKQETIDVHERIRTDGENTIRRDSSAIIKNSRDSSVKVLTNNHNGGENNRTDSERRGSTENCSSVTERRISNITANLFGAESEGSGSDSDVEIIDVTTRDSQPVYDISDSDQEMQEDSSAAPHSDEVDMLSDSDTFDECLRIFEETERRLAAKSAKSQKLGINLDTAKLRE